MKYCHFIARNGHSLGTAELVRLSNHYVTHSPSVVVTVGTPGHKKGFIEPADVEVSF